MMTLPMVTAGSASNVIVARWPTLSLAAFASEKPTRTSSSPVEGDRGERALRNGLADAVAECGDGAVDGSGERRGGEVRLRRIDGRLGRVDAGLADRTSALLAGSSFTALPSCVDLRLIWTFLIATTALAFVCASLIRFVCMLVCAFASAVSADLMVWASFARLVVCALWAVASAACKDTIDCASLARLAVCVIFAFVRDVSAARVDCASLARLVVCVLTVFATAVSAEAIACASLVAVAVALFCALCNDNWRLVRLAVGPETVMACACPPGPAPARPRG